MNPPLKAPAVVPPPSGGQRPEFERIQVLEASQREQSELLAAVSSELGTPINGIVGMSDLLLMTPLDIRQSEMVESVRTQAGALASVVQDLVDLSEIASGKLQLTDELFELDVVLDRLIDLVARKAEEKGLELAIIVDLAVPNSLRGDATRLHQILFNLISHGIRRTEVGEIVLEIRQELDTTRLHFSVHDCGPGLSDDRRAQVFKPFFRFDAPSGNEWGGTGLGLVLCQRLVTLMQGQIGVTKSSGGGGTIWFTVPMPNTANARPAPAQACRIAIADPSPTQRRSVAAQLTSLGIAFELVPSEDALAALLRRPGIAFDWVFVDSKLFGENTAGLLQGLRARTGNRPRIALLGPLTDPIRGRAQFTEAEGFFTKPIKNSALRALLGRSRTPTAQMIVGTPFKRTAPISIQAPVSNPVPTQFPTPALPNGSPDIFPSESTPRATHVGPSASPKRNLNSAGQVNNPSGLRMLVVEDNEINRRLAVLMLEKLGHHFDIAKNGLEAVNAVEDKEYDAILMDCHMPVMDGYEATRRIRQIAATTPGRGTPRIIAMTANAMTGERERCAAVGMDDYLAKPVDIGLLRESLAKVPQTAVKQLEPTSHEAALLTSIRQAVEPLAEQLGADPIADLLASFIQDTPDQLIELRQLAGLADQQPILRRAAHSLKGSVSLFGLAAFERTALQLEDLAIAGSLNSQITLVDELEREFIRARPLLNVLVAELHAL